MPGITLDLADAAELADTLTLLAQWLSGSQEHALAESFAVFIGHPACNTDTLCTDLHSSSALAAEKTCSASRHHDQQDQAHAPRA